MSIGEQFVSYKNTVCLEQLGFSEGCLMMWITCHAMLRPEPYLQATDDAKHYYNSKGFSNWGTPAPTYQQAIDWLEREYGIYIETTRKSWLDAVQPFNITVKRFDKNERLCSFLNSLPTFNTKAEAYEVVIPLVVKKLLKLKK